MKTIQLSRGMEAIVDDEDYERISKYKWCITVNGYATRKRPLKEGNKHVLMHREILGTPSGFDTDHINGNKLDNRRVNLRVATRAQNSRNSRTPMKRSITGIRGVSPHGNGRFVAFISRKGKRFHLGVFDTKESAEAARRAKEIEMWGEFARC